LKGIKLAEIGGRKYSPFFGIDQPFSLIVDIGDPHNGRAAILKMIAEQQFKHVFTKIAAADDGDIGIEHSFHQARAPFLSKNILNKRIRKESMIFSNESERTFFTTKNTNMHEGY
jgi:hypothetical protein